MICSVLIPSRFRFDQLHECIESVFASAHETDFEVIVRFHNDDADSLGRLSELRKYGPLLRTIVGETFMGYDSLNTFFNELDKAARGDWRWQLNNDMTVMGEGWDVKLIGIQTDALVQPEIHKAGPQAIYPNDATGPAPLYHRDSANLFIPLPPGGPDTAIHQAMTQNGRPVIFLPGIGVWHHWKPDCHNIYPK